MNKRHIDFTPRKRLPEAQDRDLPEIIVKPQSEEDGRYLTIRDICRILGCGRSTAYKVIDRLKANRPDLKQSESPGCISQELFIQRLYSAEGKEGQIGTTEY